MLILWYWLFLCYQYATSKSNWLLYSAQGNLLFLRSIRFLFFMFLFKKAAFKTRQCGQCFMWCAKLGNFSSSLLSSLIHFVQSLHVLHFVTVLNVVFSLFFSFLSCPSAIHQSVTLWLSPRPPLPLLSQFFFCPFLPKLHHFGVSAVSSHSHSVLCFNSVFMLSAHSPLSFAFHLSSYILFLYRHSKLPWLFLPTVMVRVRESKSLCAKKIVCGV